MNDFQSALTTADAFRLYQTDGLTKSSITANDVLPLADFEEQIAGVAGMLIQSVQSTGVKFVAFRMELDVEKDRVLLFASGVCTEEEYARVFEPNKMTPEKWAELQAQFPLPPQINLDAITECPPMDLSAVIQGVRDGTIPTLGEPMVMP